MDKKDKILNIVYYGIIVGLFYLFVNYLLPIVMPFIIGFLIAMLLYRLFYRVTKRSIKKAEGAIALCIFYALVIVICSTIGVSLTNSLIEIFKNIPTAYNNSIKPLLDRINVLINTMNNEALANPLKRALEELGGILVSVSKSAVGVLTGILTKLPNLFIQITLVIITSFFVLLDYETIIGGIRSFLNEKTEGLYIEIEDYIRNNLAKVLKSYCAIFFLTFAELSLSLTVIGKPDPIFSAFFISFLDILPILGVGTVLIPWGIIDLIYGKFTGLWLLVIYLVITFVRQYVEPKLVGANLGLHALTSLVAMIVGLDLFGLVGMFGIPILLSFIVYHEDNIQNAKLTEKKKNGKKKNTAAD